MSQGIVRVGLGLCVLALLCGGAAAQNLVVNGSFEEPLAHSVPWPGYFQNQEATVTGWTVDPAGRGHGLNNNLSGGNDTEQRAPFHGIGRPIPDGNQVMFVQGAGETTVSQVINGMQEGAPYLVIFYTAIRPGNAGMDLRVTLGNVELLEETRFVSTGNAPYERFEYSIIYTEAEFGATPELAFHSQFPPGGDVSILYDHVQIRPPVLAADISGPGMVAQGSTVNLRTELTESVGDATYQWFYNGVELEGETDAALQLLDVVIEDSGVYSVEVTDAGGTATAAFTLLVVEALPVSSIVVVTLLALLLLASGVWFVRARVA